MKDLNYVPVYFNEGDFRSCTPSCSIDDMSMVLIQKLDIARHYYGEPIFLNSAYRTQNWECKHGRTGSSSHCKGLAVDIRCKDSKDRLRLVRSLLLAGFFRIGIGETFIHADIDASKLACMWLYPDSQESL